MKGQEKPAGLVSSLTVLLRSECFPTGLGECQVKEGRTLGPVASGVQILRFPPPLPTYTKSIFTRRDSSPHSPLPGSPEGKTVNHSYHTPLLGHVPIFYCSLFYIIIIELISKENKLLFTRERRQPQKAKIMTVCSLQETRIKLDLPLA